LGRVHVFPTVTSTNDVARRLVGEGEPAIVVADVQTRGRGRFAREWYSAEGGLWASILLFPELSPDRLGLLALTAGLTVARALEACGGLRPELLWPNDVVVGGRKVAGILAERRGNAVIVGIGVNVNQPEFPPGLPDATSVFICTGRRCNRLELLAGLAEEFTALVEKLKGDGASTVLSDIKSRMPMLGKPVVLETGWTGLGALTLQHVQGTALDLSASGGLLLRLSNGTDREFSAGKVVRVR
jgi:BirA family biotin operon repressor/biotin-[acetyl-CoA-carboxylase] ligase